MFILLENVQFKNTILLILADLSIYMSVILSRYMFIFRRGAIRSVGIDHVAFDGIAPMLGYFLPICAL